MNKVKCKKCRSIIESKYTHDFQRCACGAIAIDGEKDYQRYNYPAREDIDDCIDFSYSIYGDHSK